MTTVSEEEKDEALFDKSAPPIKPLLPEYVTAAEGFVPENAMQVYHGKDVEESVSGDDVRCGIGIFKPNFLQPLRNMKSFVVVFIASGIAQGMFNTYWNMSVSTIEKRFQIPSQTTGIIVTIRNVSHIAVVLFVAHFCGRGHRPRWLAAGCLTVGVAVLIFATPELFADKWDLDSVNPTHNQPNLTASFDKEVCLTKNQAESIAGHCRAEASLEKHKNTWTFLLMGLAQVILGVGTTAPIVLAWPYIDDNVKTKNTPVYFAIGFTGRLLGPTIGVFLGAFCLNTYIDLSKKPNISHTDPRWMGAWYLGFLIIGALSCLVSALYLFFPAKLSVSFAPNTSTETKSCTKTLLLKPTPASKPVVKKEGSLKDMFISLPRDLKRLFVNKVYMCRVVTGCIDMLVVSGYYSFASKYLEFHFGVSPADAGKTKGLSSILAVTTGTLVGGFVTRRLKLKPRHIVGLTCFSSFMISLCYFLLMTITCERRNLYSSPDNNMMLNVNSACSFNCSCAGRPFSPVCHEESGVSYYSPCHAGCTGSFFRDKTKHYTGCSCLADPSWAFPAPLEDLQPAGYFASISPHSFGETGMPRNNTVKRGFCEGECWRGFWIYVVIASSFQFVSAFPISGNQMLSFRVIDPDLKSLSKALWTLLASLFAFIPGPILMGALVDSACRLWNVQTCGQTGACLVYDLDSLRLKMHLYVAVVKMLAGFMDIYVYWKVRHMKSERNKGADPLPDTVAAKNLAAPVGTNNELTNLR